MSFKTSVILSGGKGNRMRPITNYIPKALVEVGDKPLIEYVLDMVGNTEKYVTYGHKSDLLFNKTKLDVNGYINTTGKDNAYFLYNSFVKYINEPIIVSPCDMVIEIDLNKVYSDYLTLGSPPIMVIGVNPVKGVEGDFIQYDENNIISQLSRTINSDKYCSGLQIINPYKVNQLTQKSENFYDVWKQLMEINKLKASNIIPTKWRCYDYFENIT
jgi:NDP-sugar pyrophosphorylase family protein